MIFNFIKKYGLFIFISIVVIIVYVLIISKIYTGEPKLFLLMNKDNIRFTRTIKTDDYSFWDRYDIKGTIYKYKDSIFVNGFEGTMYYIRGNNNLNIYQVRVNTNNSESDSPLLVQIRLTMEGFESGVVASFNNELVLLNEEFDKESEYKFDTSVEEKVYKENMIYTRYFEENNNFYNIDYYMDGEYLVCEMIKFIK